MSYLIFLLVVSIFCFVMSSKDTGTSYLIVFGAAVITCLVIRFLVLLNIEEEKMLSEYWGGYVNYLESDKDGSCIEHRCSRQSDNRCSCDKSDDHSLPLGDSGP